MGMVSGTGLGAWLAEALVGATPAAWLPEALFVSSGVLNVFVPSGGGQWAVQGPLVLEACHALGVPFERGIMAMAFGDELTNMLQPFWALPLLGITGLSARDILPYTLLVMVVAGAVMLVFSPFGRDKSGLTSTSNRPLPDDAGIPNARPSQRIARHPRLDASRRDALRAGNQCGHKG